MSDKPEPLTTRIELDGPELTDYDDGTKLVAYIDDLTEILDKIPEPHKKEATIRASGEYTIYTYIKYDRPETEEEKHMRLAREATARAMNERKDREQLARLKARYEN
jgi:hypothetical protein